MNRYLLTMLLANMLLFSCGSDQDPLKSHLDGLMKEQADAWNQGDVDAFMQHYWRSDSLLFIGGGGPQYGWQRTLDRYKKAYPDKVSMGELKFEMLGFDRLSEKSALISGKWQLKRIKGDLGGYYSLVWKRIDGDWKIVYDHTSSVEIK